MTATITKDARVQGHSSEAMLDSINVVEIADEQAEYCGLLLAGLGAAVTKIEPPEGNSTRQIGPFYQDKFDPNGSLFFWQYNRGKRSLALDLSDSSQRDQLVALLGQADVLLESTSNGFLNGIGLGWDTLHRQFPRLVVARMTGFGDEGPWSSYRGCDLVHLALGGPVMNCGYDPEPLGNYDMPPIAPQMWHSYHIAGEQLMIGILAALFARGRTGEGQLVKCAIHQAVSTNTELDVMSWIMRRAPLFRQTCRHAMESDHPMGSQSAGRLGPATSMVPTIAQTKDGRWHIVFPLGQAAEDALVRFLDAYQMSGDLAAHLPDSGVSNSPARSGAIPGTGTQTEVAAHRLEVAQRFIRKYAFTNVPWLAAQDTGVMIAPLRQPHENVLDEHWWTRNTFADVEHPEFGRSFTYACSKWIASRTDWRVGRRAPLLNEDAGSVLSHLEKSTARVRNRERQESAPTVEIPSRGSEARKFALDGVRILDFGWFLATAGGTRFLAALGAESIKVEWIHNPDSRLGANAPAGGRKARETATEPLEGVMDINTGGQFNNKNCGKRCISLNVRHPDGMAIAQQLVRISDVVTEGFSPGVMKRWNLDYAALRKLRPDIIYVQQSGMGSTGRYGRVRVVGPVAAALAGTSEMSGLPWPAMPAGWGYSYLDWIGAYSFASAILGALVYRDRTGHGQWIDASQTETGIFISGTSILDWSANKRAFARYGNRSPYKAASPHGIYRCNGKDRWIAIACFTDDQWLALTRMAGRNEWRVSEEFATLESRLRNQDALDDALTGWTETQDAYDLMQTLQSVGVPAGVCQTAEDRCERDPQLKRLEWLTELTGTKIGTWPVTDVPFRLSETPAYVGGTIDRGAPCYGEDNDYVYGELLGMSSTTIKRLEEDGAI